MVGITGGLRMAEEWLALTEFDWIATPPGADARHFIT